MPIRCNFSDSVWMWISLARFFLSPLGRCFFCWFGEFSECSFSVRFVYVCLVFADCASQFWLWIVYSPDGASFSIPRTTSHVEPSAEFDTTVTISPFRNCTAKHLKANALALNIPPYRLNNTLATFYYTLLIGRGKIYRQTKLRRED